MRKVIAGMIIVFFVFAGGLFAIYPPDYLYNLLFEDEFYYNPRAKIVSGREYRIRLWYYPFLRTIPDYAGREKKYFHRIEEKVQEEYPNIKLEVEEISFLNGEKKLKERLAAGDPPDIYINFNGSRYISPELQVPVDIYFSERDEEYFYTPEEQDNHLWGWPFLIYNESWAVSGSLEEEKVTVDFLKNSGPDLKLNYYDRYLLLQLLSLYGLEKPEMDGEKVEGETLEVMGELMSDLEKLREEEKVKSSSGSGMLKSFFQNNKTAVGPVNPWLKLFIARKADRGKFLPVDDLKRVYTLNIFRQENYQGHDHTRAAMETARIICREFSPEIAEALELEPGYRENETGDIRGKVLPEVHPEQREAWEEKVTPVWFKFWQEELTAEEAVEQLQEN